MKYQIKVQSVSVDKKGVVSYTNLKTVEMKAFSPAVAEKAEALADKEKGISVSMYLSHDHPIPEGYASKKLEYTTQIWRVTQVTEDEALEALSDLPF